MIRKLLLILPFVSILLTFSHLLYAGISAEAWLPDSDLLGNPYFDVIVATIKDVDDVNATKGNPPKVDLLISEVLFGSSVPGLKKCTWGPFPHGIDYGGGDANKRLEEWKAIPLKGPTVGSKMILLGMTVKLGNGEEFFQISPRCQYEYSEEKRKWVLEIIEQTKLNREKSIKEKKQKEFKNISEREEWQKKISKANIAMLCNEASLIVVGEIGDGKIVGWSSEERKLGNSIWEYLINISEQLKGEPIPIRKKVVNLKRTTTMRMPYNDREKARLYDREVSARRIFFLRNDNSGYPILVDLETGAIPVKPEIIEKIKSEISKNN